MRKCQPNAGSKPKVAFSNQASALSNIKFKCELLEMLIKTPHDLRVVTGDDSEGAKSFLNMLPNSLRTFNAWRWEHLPADVRSGHRPFHTNAQATLRSSTLLERVQDAVDLVKALQATPPASSTREDNLAFHRRQTKLANALRAIADRAIIGLKKEALRLQEELDAQVKKVAAANDEGARRLTAARARIAELEAALKKKGSNVVALDSAKPRRVK
jgi:hypothetical protein